MQQGRTIKIISKNAIAKMKLAEYNRVMVKVGRAKIWYIVAAVFLGIFGVAIKSLYNNNSVGALTSNLSMAATIQPSITLTLSTDNPTLNINPSSTGTFSSTSVIVGAHSNGSIGYTLTMAAASTTLNGRGANSIPTLASAVSCTGGNDCTSSNFTTGRWGIAVDSGAYSPASTSTTNLLTVANTTSASSSTSKTVRLGANLDLSTPVDEYTTAINFALVSSSVAQYDVTFDYDDSFVSFALEDIAGNVVTPNPAGANANSKTYTLDYAGTYKVAADYVTIYEFGSMSLSSGSGFINGDTFTVGGASTVAVTSQRGPLVCRPSGTTVGTNTNSDVVCMQDISNTNRTSVLSSMTAETDYILYDSRDASEYVVTKLDDGNVWMTKNLDLCIGCANTAILTSENTDLNEYDTAGDGSGTLFDDYTYDNGVITWAPTLANTNNATLTGTPVTIDGTTVSSWTSENYAWQAEGGDVYRRPGVTHTSLASCEQAGLSSFECAHYYIGNFYNFTAAVAMSNTSSYTSKYTVMPNSICPKGWRLPNGLTNPNNVVTQSDFDVLLNDYDIANGTDLVGGTNVGWKEGATSLSVIEKSPLYFVRSGAIYSTSLDYFGIAGFYWTSTITNTTIAYALGYSASSLRPAATYARGNGYSIRCILK